MTLRHDELKILLPVLLIVLGGVYKFVLAKPAPAPKPKIAGEVYVMPKDFLINLKGGRFAKLNVGAGPQARATSAAGTAAGGGTRRRPRRPTGYGMLPAGGGRSAAIITDTLTDQPAARLHAREDARQGSRPTILKRIHHETDVEVDDVLFTDIAIQ